MGDRDLIGQSLRVSSRMGAAEALARARAAVEATPKVHNVHPHIVSEWDDGFEVALKPRGLVGSANPATTFTVVIDSGDGDASVVAQAKDYVVVQQKMFFFIPIGPKAVPGSKLYANCLDAIRQAFDGRTA